MENMLTVDLSAKGFDLESEERSVKLGNLDVAFSGGQLAGMVTEMEVVSPKVAELLRAAGPVSLVGDGELTMRSFDGNLSLAAAPGKLTFAGAGSMSDKTHYDIHASLETDGYLDLGVLFPAVGPAGIEGKMEAFYTVAGNERHGNAEVALPRVALKLSLIHI